MGTREWLLTAAVIVVPLVIAVIVTAWSLEQARYRPKRRPGHPARRDQERQQETGGGEGETTASSSPSQPS